MSRPIIAQINSTALETNLNIIRQHAPKTRIWSVVKANGYGHSLAAVLQGLRKTDGFALLDLNDAVMLRENGWNGPILLLEGFFNQTDLMVIDHYRLTTVIHSVWQIKALSHITPKLPLYIYLKLNSGMNRLGFDTISFFDAWHTIKQLKQVKHITLMTHFADSNKLENIERQMKVVSHVNKKLRGTYCLANSAAILWHSQTHAQWIRPGIILYGASPSGKWKDIEIYKLQVAMTLQSKIIAIQKLPIGEGYIGYGSKLYLSHKTQYIGIVACGYADGYPRHAPAGTPILVDGTYTKTIGTVSMDTLMVDLDPCPQATIGSLVELWGKHIKIDDVASAAGTLSYELMSKVMPRVKMLIT